MPSGITQQDSMAYTGREPWHRLGTRVLGNAMTAQEAMTAANMDWTVELQEIYTAGIQDVLRPNGENPYGMMGLRPVDRHKAVVRSDTEEILGVVGRQYTVAQNWECFDFLDSIVYSGDAHYHTVGSLWGGRRVWLLALLEGNYTLDNGEDLEAYILLDSSHNGSSSLRMRLTTVRVVCGNTLDMASRGRAGFAARHTSGIMSRVAEARELLGLQSTYMQRYMADCNMLAQQAWSRDEMRDLTYDLLRLDRKETIDNQRGAKATAGRQMLTLFTTGMGNAGETRWDAYNAVTEYIDHYLPYGNRINSVGAIDSQTATARLDNSWFGAGGQQLRNRAWGRLVEA